MKITSVEPLVVDIGSRNWLFVVVETDEGLSGVGEGSLPGHPLAVAAAVEEYREYLVGEDPARIQHLWQVMYRQPFFRSGAVTPSAMSALEQALREAVGEDVEIAWDAHGRFTPAMSIKLARALEPYNIWFLEEPALPENAKGLAQVARATSIPVATGERLFTKWAFREVLELGG